MRLKPIFLLAAMLLFVGCTDRGTTSEQKKEIESQNGKTVINIPTASTTGALYPLGSSIASLWNEKMDNVKVSAQASNGGIENLNLLQSGEAQVSMAVVSNIYQSFNGEEKFDGRANDKIRIIAGLYFNPNQIVVRDGSDINSLEDIKGKRFATGAPGSTVEDEAKAHFLSSGIGYPDGIKAQFIGFTEAVDLMRNKQLDGAWIMAGIPTAAVTEMTTTSSAKLIGISDELYSKMKEKYPWYSQYTIPANTYKGQTEEVKTTAIKMAMFTTRDLPDDIVYEMTKTFWENIETLKQTNVALKDVNVEDAVKDLADLPLHDGAIKYYKEIGVLE